MSTKPAFIGLGSNLDKPEDQVKRAVLSLQELPNTQLLKVSSWYKSTPVGPKEQPDYINGVAMLHTELQALTLLDALQKIENQHKRIRDIHWGPRTLDLDLLLYGDDLINHSRLIVPHPHMLERNFVMVPLAELDPEVRVPHYIDHSQKKAFTTAAEHSLRLGTDGLIQL